MRKAWDGKGTEREPQRRELLAPRHGGVNSSQHTAGENLALQFRGGDTLRGNKRALDISRHLCISRNLPLFASGRDDRHNVFSARLGGQDKRHGQWRVQQRGPNVFSTMSSKFCCAFYMQVQGEVRGEEGRGEERGGRAAGEAGGGGVGGFRRNADRLY